MGGRGSGSNLSGNNGLPQQDNTSSYIRSINDNYETRQDILDHSRTVLSRLGEGGRVRMTFDNSDIVAEKQPTGRWITYERGIRYNADGSYSPYNRQMEVSMRAVQNYMGNAVRFSIQDSDGLQSKQFSERNDRRRRL